MTRTSLILLPGLDGTGALFAPLLVVIPSHINARVISYPVDQPHSYDALLNMIEEQLRDERDIVLIAESFSGPLSLRYAAMHPDRVRAVVLCVTFIRSPAPRWLKHFARSFIVGLPLPGFAVRRNMVGKTGSSELIRQVKQNIRKVKPKVLAARLREVFDVDCSEALRECKVPILYIAAARDAVVGRSSMEAIRAIRPDIQFATIDAPHLLLQCAPQEAWNQIAAFIGIDKWSTQ